MTVFYFSVLIFIFSYFAGFLGAITGFGGGIIIIPILVLFFNINIHYAMGASLVAAMATSSTAAYAYMRSQYTNFRIGLFLEIMAVIGAFFGALLVAFLSKSFIAILLSLILFLSAYLTIKRDEEKDAPQTSHPWATALNLDGTYLTREGVKAYHVARVPYAFFMMGLAGILSGLLGIGAGTLKVLVMDQALGLPYKIATATSNFMIGITAAVSAGIYFSHGYINPSLTFPVLLGVIIGSFSGAKILKKIHHRTLRIIFSVLICIIGLQLLYNALSGTL